MKWTGEFMTLQAWINRIGSTLLVALMALPGHVRGDEPAKEPAPPAETKDTPAAEAKDSPAAEGEAPSEAPPEPPRRNEFIQRPGAPREKLADLMSTKSAVVAEPQGVRIDELLRGQKSDDAALDGFAKAHASRLTKPGDESNREILNIIDRYSGRNGADRDALQKYKAAVIKHLGGVMDNSVLVQVNAMNVATEMQTGDADTTDGVELFLSTLRDDKKHDSVHFMALNGIIRAKEKGLVRANEETEAVGLILDHLAKKDVQAAYQAKLFETLGALERAYQKRPGDAQTAAVLAEAALDPNLSESVRGEAGMALARMRLAEVPDWNSLLQAQILAQALLTSLDLPVPELANSTKAADRQRFLAYRWAKALLKGLSEPPNQANADFKDFVQSVALEKVLYPAVATGSVDLAPIEEWIEKHPAGKDFRLAPRAKLITWPMPEKVEEETEKDAAAES